MTSVVSIAIVGSRHAVSVEHVTALIDAFLLDFAGQRIEIVSGGASGVDQIAADYARRNGHALVQYRPDAETGTFSQRAFKRNTKIATRACHMLALPCEHSTGTYVTVRLFNAKSGPKAAVHVIPCGLRDKRITRSAPLGAQI
jgi:hypothetical protein